MLLKLNPSYFVIACILFLLEVIIALSLKEGFIRHTVGDYLAAILLYCFMKSIIETKPLFIALMTLFISYGIEWLQLINILQTLNLEDNILIKTLLGSSFSIGDLIAYTMGATTIYSIDLKNQKL